MGLSTFLDIVWAEIWDDCPPLGDQAQYREIMVRLFIDGDAPHEITYTTSDGKTHRLSEPPRRRGVRGKPSKDQMDAARALHEQLKAAKAAATGLASPEDG